MGQTATADRSTATTTEAPPSLEEPMHQDPELDADSELGDPEAGSTDETERAAFPSVVARWSQAQTQMVKAMRDWGIANWADLIEKTGGRDLPRPKPDMITELISGTFGNFWTDAPLAVFVAAGVAVPEAAVPALIVSSVMATVVEMIGTAFAAYEGTEEFSDGVEVGAATLRAIVVNALAKCDTAEGGIDQDAISVASRGATESAAVLANARTRMDHTSRQLEFKAKEKVKDRSLYEHLLHEWVQLHMVARESAPKSVDNERFEGALEEVGGREQLESEAPRGETETVEFGPGDAREITPVQHQFAATRIMLERAGLDPELAMPLLGSSRPIDSLLLRVADTGAYRAFLDQYWPGQRKVDPSEDDYALVAICVHEVSFDQYLKYIEFTPYVNTQAIGAAVTLEP
jgi:hypothetical protein